ncbi:MAG TPA: glycosyltransferase family 39 protein [Candidatus Acidoferrales bacterium]|nr:glycosyltransferase family 39 protein [Candidatus Acidoferrales bacterium]
MRIALGSALAAFALTLLYGVILQPQWEPQLNDQMQYLALARQFVERGEFTRAVGAEPFVPETLRLPGYPLLLAPICVGGCDHWRIAVLQGALLAVLVITTWRVARRILLRRAALAAVATALYVPFAYYGSLALSDLPGAVLLTIGCAQWLLAIEQKSPRFAVAAGALFGWASLMRGTLLFVSPAIAMVALAKDRSSWRVALITVVASAITFAPYVAYSELSFGRAVGGNSGTVMFLGYLQGRDASTFDDFERTQVTAARAQIEAFDAVADRTERALAWLTLDDSLGARARSLIAHDPVGWLARAVARSAVLWGGEQPVRGGASGDLAALLGAVQLVLFAASLGGAIVLARRGDQAALLVGVVILYVWITALPFQTEARYALPAQAFALLAAVALLDVRRRTSA